MYGIIWSAYDITSNLYDITPCCDITPTVFMSSQPVYLSLHLCSCIINYSVLIIKHLLYVWHQTHYMYDITWFYMTSHSLFIKSQYCIHDFISTLFMTAHPLYMTSHTLYLWHHSHCIYDKIPLMFMTWYSLCRTSHMVYAWRYNHGIWHHTHCVSVISPTWLMISQPMYVWNHSHWM